MSKTIDDMISRGCYSCEGGIAGTATAYLAIAKSQLVLTETEDQTARTTRRPVIVCVACAHKVGLVEDAGQAEEG